MSQRIDKLERLYLRLFPEADIRRAVEGILKQGRAKAASHKDHAHLNRTMRAALAKAALARAVP